MEELNKQSKLELLFYYIDVLAVLITISDTDINEECALELLNEVYANKVIIIIVKNLYKKMLNKSDVSTQDKIYQLEYITNSIQEKIEILKQLNNLK